MDVPQFVDPFTLKDIVVTKLAIMNKAAINVHTQGFV